MDDSTHTDAPGYLLPEISYQSLQELRNLMFLMASTTYAVTVEEEAIPLCMPRSLLAERFHLIGTQLADALDTTRRVSRIHHDAQRTH
jgi:hypothetical protein